MHLNSRFLFRGSGVYYYFCTLFTLTGNSGYEIYARRGIEMNLCFFIGGDSEFFYLLPDYIGNYDLRGHTCR